MNAARKSLVIAQVLRRNVCQSAVLNKQKEVTVAGRQKIKDLQKKFQIDDGVPVYLKGGAKDKAMFQGTIVLLAIGLTMGVTVLVKAILPKEN